MSEGKIDTNTGKWQADLRNAARAAEAFANAVWRLNEATSNRRAKSCEKASKVLARRLAAVLTP